MSHSGKQNGVTRGAALLLLVAAFLLLAPQAAFAHAKLLRSEPKPKSILPQPPKVVELWFSEEPEASFNTIEVKDAQGNRFDRGEVTLAEGGKKAQAELQDLPAGAYTVEWKALSSDEHTLRGKFAFTVEASAAPAAARTTPAPPAGVLVLLVTAFLVFVTPGRNHPAMSAGGDGQPPSVTQAK